jgi:uncharacterized OB-fold protein
MDQVTCKNCGEKHINLSHCPTCDKPTIREVVTLKQTIRDIDSGRASNPTNSTDLHSLLRKVERWQVN